MVGYMYTIFIVLFIVGFFQTTPRVFITFTFAVKVLMALFLLYRFNPFSNKRMTYTVLDQEIILASALFILISSFTDYINHFIEEARRIVTHNLTKPFL
jgi:hypothetical protein